MNSVAKHVFKSEVRRILRPNMFLNRKSALRSGTFFASTELMHRPRPDSPLHFEIKNTYQIRTENSNASARRLLLANLLQCWPQVCRVKITLNYYGPIRSFPLRPIR